MQPEARSLRMKRTTNAITKHLVVPDDPTKPITIYDTELPGFGAYGVSERPGSYFVH